MRPTGIVDPDVEVRETRNQIDDLMNEIRERVERDERVLVTTLTKKMSEDLSHYLLEMGFKMRYLHSEIDTLERIQIIRDLRLGEYDVLVGVNLLREGLDLPEVSLVAILDADKEGFLRGETSLIQTIGRAARNVDGHGADVRRQGDAGDAGGDRRRPTAAARSSSPTTRSTGSRRRRSSRASPTSPSSCRPSRRCRAGANGARRSARQAEEMPQHELERMVVELEEEMLAAAEELRFEYAAQLRDELRELRRDLREIHAGEAPASARGAGIARLRRRHRLGSRAVDLDRQAIERRDFPIGRRGYDPAAVDAHLRALAGGGRGAAARRAATAAREPLAGLDGGSRCRASSRPPRPPPPRSSARRRGRARQRPRRGRPRRRAHARGGDRDRPARTWPRSRRRPPTLLERVGSMDARGAAPWSRACAPAPAGSRATCAAVEANMGELYDAASGARHGRRSREPAPAPRAARRRAARSAQAPAIAAAAARRRSPAPRSTRRSAPSTRRRARRRRRAAPSQAAEPPSAAGDGDLDGARLVALNMALNGESRAETDRYLAENFQLADRLKLIDEVYAAIEG